MTAELAAFETLGLATTATEQDMREAYMALARRWHPNDNTDNEQGGADERMVEINDAMQMLGKLFQRRRLTG